MAQYNLKEQLFCGDRHNYYSYDEELYTGTFPLEWAETHLPLTGPKECGNCRFFGSWNGVFIGYCINCAIYQYKGQRGSGFIGNGVEYKITNNDWRDLLEEYQTEQGVPSIFETYLKNIKMDDIGDKDFIDSAKVYLKQTSISNEETKEEMDEDNEYFEYLERNSLMNEEYECCCSYYN